ncbi:MAG: cyclodeaminase/cyclohydrolase family protein [Herpetosiphon sp.]
MSSFSLDQTLHEFLDQLASKSATPGGGSASALVGAMAAALVTMECNLTLGKARFADVEATMAELRERAEALRSELQQLAEEDVAVFNRLTEAYKLPRITESDIAIRRDAIQNALRHATEVPLRTAQAAAAILPLCAHAAQAGNPAAVSDVGAGLHLAQAALNAALLNVNINLRAIEDGRFVARVRGDVNRLTDGLSDEVERISALVAAKMKA